MRRISIHLIVLLCSVGLGLPSSYSIGAPQEGFSDCKQLFAELNLEKEGFARDGLRKGDFVRIAKAENKQQEPLAIQRFDKKSALVFRNDLLPAIARFERWDAQGNAVVVLSLNNWRSKFIVPAENVGLLATGSRAHFRALARIFDIPLLFVKDEAVRFRASDGRISVGQYLSGDARRARVKTTAGVARISQSHLFRGAGPQPRTPVAFLIEGTPKSLDINDTTLRLFLDGGARVTSLPEFRASNDSEKLQSLVDYVRGFVPYDTAASYSEYYGLEKFSDNLCAGAGTCRHQATLLAALLAETGLEVRLMGRFRPEAEGGGGHRWLEVKMGDAIYVVDPSSRKKQVLPLEEAEEKARTGGPDSFEALWFTHPARKAYQEVDKF